MPDFTDKMHQIRFLEGRVAPPSNCGVWNSGFATVNCPSVCQAVTLMYRRRRRIYWISSKVITGIISLCSSLLDDPSAAICFNGNTRKIRVDWNRGGVLF